MVTTSSRGPVCSRKAPYSETALTANLRRSHPAWRNVTILQESTCLVKARNPLRFDFSPRRVPFAWYCSNRLLVCVPAAGVFCCKRFHNSPQRDGRCSTSNGFSSWKVCRNSGSARDNPISVFSYVAIILWLMFRFACGSLHLQRKEPAFATARTTTDVEVYALPADHFNGCLTDSNLAQVPQYQRTRQHPTSTTQHPTRRVTVCDILVEG